MENKKIKSNNDEHRKIMFKVLKDIFQSNVRSKIAFKWWTLCMFLYSLDRFSVDLDFDIIDKNISVFEIKDTLRNIVNKYGDLKEETNTKLILKYDNNQIPLKIEFNSRISKNDKYEVKNLFGDSIMSMEKDCIFWNKLVAISERKKKRDKVAPRDLYDIRFFFKNKRPINHDLILERTWKVAEDYLKDLLTFIPQNFNKENILRWLGDLVTEKQKFFIKNKLIKEVLSEIEFYIWNSTH